MGHGCKQGSVNPSPSQSGGSDREKKPSRDSEGKGRWGAIAPLSKSPAWHQEMLKKNREVEEGGTIKEQED